MFVPPADARRPAVAGAIDDEAPSSPMGMRGREPAGGCGDVAGFASP